MAPVRSAEDPEKTEGTEGTETNEDSELFLRACRRQPVSRTPVWFMRQAGRYMEEYRRLRARHSMLELCRTPELATEITLLPVNKLGVDAAIIFADLLLPAQAMGMELAFVEGEGPVLSDPVRTERAVRQLARPLGGELDCVGDAIRAVCAVRKTASWIVSPRPFAPRAPVLPARCP